MYRRLGYIAISRFTLWAGHRGGPEVAERAVPPRHTFREIVDPVIAAEYRVAGWWDDSTLAGMVTEHARDWPDGIAYAADDGDLTWRALDACSDRIAGTLLATGAAPGARSASFSPTVGASTGLPRL